MAREGRVGGRHHRYNGSGHSSIKGYDTKNAPEQSTANKNDPGKHHQASYMPGIGSGHSVSHVGAGERRGLMHLNPAKARTGY
jgi:hypothetical protein